MNQATLDIRLDGEVACPICEAVFTPSYATRNRKTWTGCCSIECAKKFRRENAPKRKTCTKCGEEKPLRRFPKSKLTITGRGSICHACNSSLYKRNTFKRKYGITPEQYEDMERAQNGLCAICNLPESATGKFGAKKKLAVDHCHKTGGVRGLLCHNCNTGIGALKDDLEILKAAIGYLTR